MMTYDVCKAESLCAGETNDCAVIAVSIVTQYSYSHVWSLMNKHGREYRQATEFNVIQDALADLGRSLVRIYDDRIQDTHDVVKYLSHAYSYLVFTPKHVSAVIGRYVEDCPKISTSEVSHVYMVVNENCSQQLTSKIEF